MNEENNQSAHTLSMILESRIDEELRVKKNQKEIEDAAMLKLKRLQSECGGVRISEASYHKISECDLIIMEFLDRMGLHKVAEEYYRLKSW
jgi:hypothetical protein